MRAAIIALLALAGCSDEPTPPTGPISYDGIQTRLLDDELVSLTVRVTNATTIDEVAEYTECAAAQYALIRGYGFARNVRTLIDEEGGIWTGDAVYTVSPALPRGTRKIDAEVTVAECERRAIPTV